MLLSNNTIFKTINKKMYVKYYNHNTFFDQIIKQTDIPIFDISLEKTALPFGCTLHNNPFQYIDSKKYAYDNVIFMHQNNWSQKIKKEDLALMQSHLQSNYKICFDPSIFSKFQSDNVTNYIKYGLPKPEKLSEKRNKEILVLNTNKSQPCQIVYKQLKHIYPNTDILDNNNLSYDELCYKLSEYKTVFSEGITINEIVANVCGCYVFSSGLSYEGSIGAFETLDMDNLLRIIENKITEDISVSTEQKDNLLSIYNFGRFSMNLEVFFNNLTQKI
jgi:hypothetical protein